MRSSLHTLSIRLAIPLICLIAGAGVATIYTGASAQSTGYTCMPAPGSVGGPAYIPSGGGGGGGSTGGSVADEKSIIMYSGVDPQSLVASSSGTITTDPLVFKNRFLDPDNEWNGSRLTAVKGGWYTINLSLYYSLGPYLSSYSTGMSFAITLNKNGSSYSTPFSRSASTADNTTLSARASTFTSTVFLLPGEYIEIVASLYNYNTAPRLTWGSSDQNTNYISITRSYAKP